jgi:hypothetical protein
MAHGISGYYKRSICDAEFRPNPDLIHQKMVTQVNKKLPQESQFSPLGWYAPKTRRLLREYRRLLTSGKLLWLERALGVAMAACCLCLIWAIGFFQALFGTRLQ